MGDVEKLGRVMGDARKRERVLWAMLSSERESRMMLRIL